MIGFISEAFLFAAALCAVAVIQILLTLKLGLGKMVRRWVATGIDYLTFGVKLVGTLVVLTAVSTGCKTRMGRKTSVVRLPNWAWLVIVAKTEDGSFKRQNLIDYIKSAGGAFATCSKKHDIVFLLKGFYSADTERFVLEHELGHVRHNHVPRLMAAGQVGGIGSVVKFELEADVYAASVVGWSNAYYALTEIQQKICEEFGQSGKDIVSLLAARKVAIMEKWKSSPIPV